jgi:hypothetical protein
MSIEFLRPNICTTMSGAPIYGTYWPPNTQAYGSPSDQSSYGAFGQQALTQAQLAQQQALAQQAYQSGFYTSPEPEPIEDAGISAGEIIGHRAWRVRDDGLLQSMAVSTVWAPNEVMEGKPSDYNGMGVHAFKTASAALTEYWGYEIAIGTVLLWGEVIEHELGYRAQFGKVNSIDFFYGEKSKPWVWSWWAGWRRRDEPDELQRLRHRYGV